MDRRRLGGTPIEVTPIGLGCMQWGAGMTSLLYPAVPQRDVTAIVRAALDGGIGWFDTAEMYGGGNSERMLTTALTELAVAPGEVAIATKWNPLWRTASSIRRTIDARLAALQGYPIDLHQIHMPYGNVSSLTRQVREMAELYRAHRVAAIGVCNFSARQMELAHDVLGSYGMALAANQVQINLLHRAIEHNGVLETARRLGVTLIAYSPLRSGLLTGRLHDDPAALRGMHRLRRTFGNFTPRTIERTAPLIDEMRRIGAAHGASVAQIALAWLVTFYGDTVVAIPGASRPEQARQAAQSMGVRLSQPELARLDELSRAGLTGSRRQHTPA